MPLKLPDRTFYRVLASFLLGILLVISGCVATPFNTTEPISTEGPPPSTMTQVDRPTGQPSPVIVKASPSSPPPTEIRPTEPPTLVPSPDATGQPSPSPEPIQLVNDLSLSPEDITFYPSPSIYDGDLVTIQVAPNLPNGVAPNEVDVRVTVDDQEIVDGHLNWRLVDGDSVGLYQWAWDTAGQEGDHLISAVLDAADRLQIGDENPDNNSAEITVKVEPISALPPLEANATWVTVDSECCRLHVVSGTAAHRDLERLKTEVDAAFQAASEVLWEPLDVPYDVYLVDKVFGQGGFTNDSMVISYLDRNYAGGGLTELLTHEASHLIDKQFAPDHITFLSEGIAVWVAGGHYQQQDLGQRMAGLIELGQYVPLKKVIDDFYDVQHEISYLEAASFIDFLVEVHGWTAVRAFYEGASPGDGATLSEAIDANTLYFFGKNLDLLEAEWLDYLDHLPRDRSGLTDIQALLRFYELMRRYQSTYDPTAYYLSAWLPSPENAEHWGVTADFSRHPESLTNITLEVMLTTANKALFQEDYDRLNALLASVERVMKNEDRFLDPLAKSYYDIVVSTSEEGLEAQQVVVEGNQATVLAKPTNRTNLQELKFFQNRDREWQLIQ